MTLCFAYLSAAGVFRYLPYEPEKPLVAYMEEAEQAEQEEQPRASAGAARAPPLPLARYDTADGRLAAFYYGGTKPPPHHIGLRFLAQFYGVAAQASPGNAWPAPLPGTGLLVGTRRASSNPFLLALAPADFDALVGQWCEFLLAHLAPRAARAPCNPLPFRSATLRHLVGQLSEENRKRRRDPGEEEAEDGEDDPQSPFKPVKRPRLLPASAVQKQRDAGLRPLATAS